VVSSIVANLAVKIVVVVSENLFVSQSKFSHLKNLGTLLPCAEMFVTRSCIYNYTSQCETCLSHRGAFKITFYFIASSISNSSLFF
jgi:hypothetical protein